MKRPFLFFFILAAIAAGMTMIIMGGRNGNESTSGGDSAATIGGPFSLLDQTGKRVTDKDFAGKYMLVYFGYTFCPDVCPTELQTMTAAMEKLGDLADEITPVFITVDPERDGVREMAAYVPNFSKRLVGLTGTPQEIAAVARAYRVYYAKVREKGSDDNDYAMDHSAIVYLMDRKGHYAGHFAYGTTPDKMAARIRSILIK